MQKQEHGFSNKLKQKKRKKVKIEEKNINLELLIPHFIQQTTAKPITRLKKKKVNENNKKKTSILITNLFDF